MAASAILASNKVNDRRPSAYVEHTDGDRRDRSVTAAGSVTIAAEGRGAGIFSNSKLVSSSITTNDGGASVIQETLNDLFDADHSTDSVAVNLQFGDRVRLADDYAVATYETNGSDDLDVTLTEGEFVKLTDDFVADGVRGDAGSIYRYIGTGISGTDLHLEDFTTGNWVEVGGNAGSIYKYLGEDFPGGQTQDLSRTNHGDLDFWREVLETQLVPQGLNVTGSDSIAIGGMIVVNAA